MANAVDAQRCDHAWADNGLLSVLTLAQIANAKLHDCHKAKGHTGDHECACGKKIAQT